MFFITQYYGPDTRATGKIYLSTVEGVFFKGDRILGKRYNFHGMQQFVSDKPKYIFKLTIE